MRFGLIVDSACDLPWQFLEKYKIRILPISVRIDGELIEDRRDPQQTSLFYRSGLLAKGHDVESVPYTVEQIRALFLEQVVVDYDFALVQTITQTRSPIYAHASQAMQRIMAEYRQYREAAGVAGSFSMRVLDTRNLFAGQGVIAAETLRLVESEVPRSELRSRIEALTRRTYGFAVVPDVYYVRERAQERRQQRRPGQRPAGQSAGHRPHTLRPRWGDLCRRQGAWLRDSGPALVRLCRAAHPSGPEPRPNGAAHPLHPVVPEHDRNRQAPGQR